MNKNPNLKHFMLGEKVWTDFKAKTLQPRTTQKELLKRILSDNAETVFGKKYNFRQIKTPKDFRGNVPIHPFEKLEPYLKGQEAFRKPVLTIEQPERYVQSSGTTARSKFIPVLNRTFEQAILRNAIFRYLHFPEGKYPGKFLSIVGSVVDGKTENNSPCGSYSGLLYDLIPDEEMENFVLPKSFFKALDYDSKYLLISGLALVESDIGVLVGANPAIFIKLQNTIKENWSELLSFVETGNVDFLGLDKSYQKLIPENFKGYPERAKTLKRIASTENEIKLKSLWPKINTLITWTSGSCGFVLPKVKKLLPINCRVLDLGYLASEFIGTITVDIKTNSQVPFLSENYYEFMEPTEWKTKGVHGRVLGLEDLEEGRLYFIIVTTQTGLYRYFINDLVEKTGSYNNTPTIRFVQKGVGAEDISGELLYEGQLISAIKLLNKERGLGIDFFILLGSPEKQNYTLYFEGDKPLSSKTFEETLTKFNAGVEVMRKEGTLKPTKIVSLKKGAGEAYKKHCIQNGQAEGQFKYLTLQNEERFEFDFNPYRLRT